MRMNVSEVARLLNVSTKEIYRWVEHGQIPCHRVQDQFWFHRAELLEWATAHGHVVASDIFHDLAKDPDALPTLAEALEAGDVHHGVGGSDVAGVLSEAAKRVRLPDEVDRELVLEMLLAREASGSTGIGDGIAIPHVRSPILLHGAQPAITLCFLEHGIEFDAVDGKPVTALFLLVSPTTRIHLHFLSRLSAALHDAGFRAAVGRRATRDELVAEAQRFERSVVTSIPPQRG